jgi:hypothetical protein
LLVVATKLKYHRLKPGGVRERVLAVSVATKLKYHRLKPGGVRERVWLFLYYEVEVPPAEAGGVLRGKSSI